MERNFKITKSLKILKQIKIIYFTIDNSNVIILINTGINMNINENLATSIVVIINCNIIIYLTKVTMVPRQINRHNF